MRESIQTNVLQSILAVADKHPNSKISKLIKNVESQKSSKNIVLLLMELAEHPEFAYDHSISLQYYLHMFQELPEETSFSDTGLLLLNSAIIYGKRVDEVHLSIERLIISLIKNDLDNKTNDVIQISSLPTPKRGKKRPLEELYGPYEANMQIKRFKTVSNNKRFENGTSVSTTDLCIDGGIEEYVDNLNKNYNHPTIWKHSLIEDFDYDDESDSKKNYKLFTYHLEHRYNTLIPDINFKMYYKMKDFINIKCRDSSNVELWPPLSDAYIEHYVNVENQILSKEGLTTSVYFASDERTDNQTINNARDISCRKKCQVADNPDLSLKDIDAYSNKDKLDTDSGVDLVYSNLELTETCLGNKNNNTVRDAEAMICVHSITEDNINDKTSANEINYKDNSVNKTNKDQTSIDLQPNEVDLTSIKVILPHLDDEGVFFSDLDERDQQMLSPAVVATDVFRCMKNKNNIIVIVDDEIKKMYNIQEPKEQVLTLPIRKSYEMPPLPINLLKIAPKYLRKRRAFKLGPEYHLLKKERQKKYERDLNFPTQSRTWVQLNEDVTGVSLSPTCSEDYEPDFYGFPEDIPNDKNRSLSRDSGISLHHIDNTLERDISDNFLDEQTIIPQTLEPTDPDELLEFNRTLANEKTVNNLSSTISSKDDNNQKSIVQTNKENQNNGAKCKNDEAKVRERKGADEISQKLTSIMTKVQKWHTHLQPILAQSRDLHHFDIFELGSEILNQFDKCGDNSQIVSLNHVMENKPSSLVSRYFLSTLLLANQGNINININNRNTETPSELIDVQLKLLSKKRNVVSLEDNTGLITPTISIMRPFKEQTLANVRTLKPVPNAPKCEDHDSGISLSSI